MTLIVYSCLTLCLYSNEKFHCILIYLMIGCFVAYAYWTLLASYYAPGTYGIFMFVIGGASAIFGA